jgi:hypothetical protein
MCDRGGVISTKARGGASAILGSIAAIALGAIAVACSKSEPPPPSAAPIVDASAPPIVDAAPPVPVDADPTPYEIPSRQTVHIRLAERDGGKQRVLLPGFVIEQVNAAGAVRKFDVEPPNDCPCGGCPPPPKVTVSGLTEITWDARAYATWAYMAQCDSGRVGTGSKSALQPLPPGHYRVQVLVATCEADKSGKSAKPGEKCRESGARPDVEEIDLPASGDVVVEIK